jgi:hypothetical protein
MAVTGTLFFESYLGPDQLGMVRNPGARRRI